MAFNLNNLLNILSQSTLNGLTLAGNLLNNLIRNQNGPPLWKETDVMAALLSTKDINYADVPNEMLYCHLCKKDMWDSTSFENHLKGKAHIMIRESLEKSYILKAKLLRQEAKLAELSRMRRSRKSKTNDEYCRMCDINCYGHLSSHRKSESHLALKQFLHPKCIECNKDFRDRIDYDTHLLMPDHLKKAAKYNAKMGERKQNLLNILTENDELKDVKRISKKKKKRKDNNKTDDVQEKPECIAEEDENIKENVDEECSKLENDQESRLNEDDDEETDQPMVEDPEDCILDYRDGDEVPPEVGKILPKYNWQRPVGLSFISKLECYQCIVCRKFLDVETTADIHAHTITHHHGFVNFIKNKAAKNRVAQKRAIAASKEDERKKKKAEAAAKTEEVSEDNIEPEIERNNENESSNNREDQDDVMFEDKECESQSLFNESMEDTMSNNLST